MPPLPDRSSPRRVRRTTLALLVALLAAPVHADIIATDSQVTQFADAGGTADDPAVYVIGDGDSFQLGMPNMYVGLTTDFNELTVQNGAIFYANLLNVSYLESSTDNRVHVTGASTVVSASKIYFGGGGSRNRATVDQGASLNAAILNVGYASTANDNGLLISGPDTQVTVTGDFQIGLNGSNNTLTVEDGAQLATNGPSRLGLNLGATQNTMRITGAGTAWRTASFLTIGDGAENRLLIDGGSLVTVGSTLYFGAGAGNFVGLDGGFLAFQGNLLAQLDTWIAQERFRYHDDASDTWLTAGVDDLNFGYFDSDAAALDFSGYDGLAGYTIVTSYSAVPEPATVGLIAGLVMLGCVATRRRFRA